MIELISKNKKNLSNNEFNSVCLLKDEYWKYGLKKQPRKVVSLEESPKRVKEVYETIRPHYEHLESHRIILKND